MEPTKKTIYPFKFMSNVLQLIQSQAGIKGKGWGLFQPMHTFVKYIFQMITVQIGGGTDVTPSIY